MITPDPTPPSNSDGVTLHVSRRALTWGGVVILVIAVGATAFALGRSSSSTSATPTTLHRAVASTTSTPNAVSTSTTAAPTTTTAPVTTTTLPTPLVTACADASAPPVFEPSTIYIGCATGNFGTTGITWTSWTSTSATGSGTFNQNSCQPSCAGGTFTRTPVTIALTSPQRINGVPIFQTLTLTPLDGSTPTVVSEPGWGGA